MKRLFVIAIGTVLGLSVIACGSNGAGSPATPTTLEATPTALATIVPTSAPGPNEGGTSPIFWRTADKFASVRAGQPYTVLFRIDNGYNAPELSVGASCSTCPGIDNQNQPVFVGTNSPPVGADAPGSYYPMNMTFPSAGHWVLLVQANADQATIPVDVLP